MQPSRATPAPQTPWPRACSFPLLTRIPNKHIPMRTPSMAKQIGYAVVGLGDAAHAVLPAFANASETSRLVAIVAGDRARAQAIAHEYRAAAYHYDEFRQCLQREDVNAVYLALPNSMHCEYAVEAARTGVHVLCDRPVAV